MKSIIMRIIWLIFVWTESKTAIRLYWNWLEPETKGK